MKKIYAAAIAAALSATVSAQAAIVPDTITATGHVTMTETPEALIVKVQSADSTTEFHMPLQRRGLTYRPQRISCATDANPLTVSSAGIALGFCSAPGAPADFNLEMGKSFEISLLQLIGIEWTNNHGCGISAGFGLGWRNYRTTRNMRIVPVDGVVTAMPYADGMLGQYSHMKTFSLTFPVLWKQRLFSITKRSSLNMRLGPIVCLNTHNSVKTGWTDQSGNQVQESCNKINGRLFTVDLFGSLSINGIGFYARYSPMSMLKGPAPRFHTFSTGLILGF